MTVLAILGIVVGLAVIVSMAVAPALVDLNERFPVPSRDESSATAPAPTASRPTT